MNKRLLTLIHVFHRILNRKYMTVSAFIDIVHNSCQRRGFPTAGRSGHQYQTARLHSELLQNIRHQQLIQCQNRIIDDTNRCTELILLAVYIHSLPVLSLADIGKVQILPLFKILHQPLIHHRKDHLCRLCILDECGIFPQHAICPNHGGTTDIQMDITAVMLSGIGNHTFQ